MKRRFAALFTLMVFVVAAVACSSSPDPTPTATISTATPSSATPTSPSQPDGQGTPQPTPVASDPAISPELAAFLAEVDGRVSRIRGIPVADAVPFRFLDDASINAYVREQIDEPEVVDDIGHADALYTLLGLIGTGDDLFHLYAALLDAQVLGAYDPEDEEFVVLQTGDQFGPSQEFTYAHEYVHRLQDARFSLDEITEQVEDSSDRSLAFSALVEGDATTIQQLYALQHLDFAQLSQILAEAQNSLDQSADTPYVLQRGLEFPYIEGAKFVERLRSSQGPEAVNDAFLEPPDSTEQILHIEKFVDRELPLDISLPDSLLAEDGPIGAGWEVLDEDTFGEFFLRTWLEAIGARSTDASEAAAGWGGDAVTLAANRSGKHVMVSKVAWDDPSLDPEQFVLVLTTIMAASPEFRRINLGANVGILAYEHDGGVVVVGNFASEEHGTVTVVAAADLLDHAMPLVLALAS